MLFRLAWWGANIYFAKRSFDTMKENIQLKQTGKEQQATIKTLATQVAGVHESVHPPLPTADEIQVVEVHGPCQ